MKKNTKADPIDNSTNKNLIKIYTDKFNNIYYGFIDPEIMPKHRVVYCERAARYAKMYISESNFKKAAIAMKKAANASDWTKMFSIVSEIEYCAHFLGEEESLYEVAAGFFIMNDEDPYELYPQDVKDKIDIWKKDKAARDFFLRQAMSLTENYSQKSPDDVLSYFDNPAYLERKDALSRYIS